MFKKLFISLSLLVFAANSAVAQKPKPKSYTSKKPAATAAKKTAPDEKQMLEKALAETDLTQKIAALKKFAADFPKSTELVRAREILVSAEAQLADSKLQAGDQLGVEFFKQAVADAPSPMSDRLFVEIVSRFPSNLLYLGQPAAAIEVAKLIEEKVASNPKQLLGVAAFYLNTENSEDAVRLAQKAIALDANLPAAYQTLGLAHRMAFRLDESEAAYTRALELDPASAVSTRSLAEMKRAAGKPAEAVEFYRQLLEKDAEDTASQTGLALALFDAEKQTEAETELNKSLTKNPNNLSLLTGAAYWYAAHRQGDRAVELARQAVALEPRYTWAHIALARGFMAQNKPLEAERELLAARQYGNFPTLNYEIAAARLAAGLYEEAAQELKKDFVVKNDTIETKLGNRVSKESKSFIELLELERRASIFQPLAADDPVNAEKLKNLLLLSQTINSKEATDEEIKQATADFVKGDDNARIFRQLYVASRLMQNKKNLPEALELTQNAVSGVDSALSVPSPAAAVMADELYESRRLAISRNEVVVIPEIPRQTLSAIVRGRIEELSGWTLFYQGKPDEAVVRLKRAVSILPEKSAWWRSSTWRLGAALDAAGKPSEALDIYIKNYQNSDPDVLKRSVIESLYQKVHGNLDGLDDKIGAKPASAEVAAASPTPNAETVAQNTPTVQPETSPHPSPETTPAPTPQQVAPEKSPSPSPETTPQPAETKPEPTPAENATPEVKIEPSPEVKIKAKPEATPTVSPAPTAQAEPEKSPEIPNQTAKAKSTPKPLFEPVIISVPKPETAKPQTSPSPEKEKSETLSKGTVAATKTESSETSGEVRPRLTVSNTSSETDKAASTDENPKCRLTVSQDSLSLLSQGGSLGILLGFQGEETSDTSKITFTSSSPDDIQVSLEPDIGKLSNRAFYVIKSISPSKGAFTVTFDSPCGKKEVLVKVR